MKKSIILISLVSAGLIASSFSYAKNNTEATADSQVASSACNIGQPCNFDLSSGDKTSLIHYPFQFDNRNAEPQFNCAVIAYSKKARKGKIVESSARIYGGKNAQLTFNEGEKDEAHNQQVDTDGSNIAFIASNQKSTDTGDDQLTGQIKIDLRTKDVKSAAALCTYVT